MKGFADDYLKFDKDSQKFSKESENTVSNFSIFLSVFQKLVLQTRKNQGLFGKALKMFCTNPEVFDFSFS